MKKKLLRFVSLALASFVLGGISTCAFAEESESEIDGSNWMSAIKPDVPITAVNMPGTHDSSTKYVDISPIFKTQDGSVSEQLYRGARYFDMRFELQKDKRLVAVHSAASCRKAYGVKAEKLTAADAVKMCADFLKKNPGETVLFQLKEGNGKTGTVFFDAFYEQCIKGQEDIWFLENRIPTLGEVRGKIVLLRVVKADRSKFDDQNSGLDFGAYPHVPVKEVINFISGSMKKASTGKTYSHLYVQDSYKLGGSKKWQAITTFLESELDPENFNICLSSCVGLGLPLMNSRIINHRLKKYDFKDGKTYGIIAMDFVPEDVCRNIYMTNSAIMTETPNAATEYSERTSFTFLGRTFFVLRSLLFGIVHAVSFIANLFYR
jgi:hypothetical protein